MAVLIKDQRTADMIAELAQRTGATKTAAVRDAVGEKLAQLPTLREPDRKPLRERLAELRRKHPLPPPTGLKADKAFYDELSGGL